MSKIEIYCDGSGLPTRDDFGGWGISSNINGCEFTVYGSLPYGASNNTAELTAATHAFLLAGFLGTDVIVRPDSEYVINNTTQSLPRWKRNGWQLRDGSAVKNQNEWRALDEAYSSLPSKGANVEFAWVKGHSGIVGNERADEGATKGRMLKEDITPRVVVHNDGVIPATVFSYLSHIGAIPEQKAELAVEEEPVAEVVDYTETNLQKLTLDGVPQRLKAERPNLLLCSKRLVYMSLEARKPFMNHYWYHGASFEKDNDQPSRYFGKPSASYSEVVVAKETPIDGIESFIKAHNDQLLESGFNNPTVCLGNLYQMSLSGDWPYILDGSIISGIQRIPENREDLVVGKFYLLSPRGESLMYNGEEPIVMVDGIPHLNKKAFFRHSEALKVPKIQLDDYGRYFSGKVGASDDDDRLYCDYLKFAGLGLRGVDSLEKRQQLLIDYIGGTNLDDLIDITDRIFTRVEKTKRKEIEVTHALCGGISDNTTINIVDPNNAKYTYRLLPSKDLPAVVDLGRICKVTNPSKLKVYIRLYDKVQFSRRYAVIIELDDSKAVYCNPYSNLAMDYDVAPRQRKKKVVTTE